MVKRKLRRDPQYWIFISTCDKGEYESRCMVWSTSQSKVSQRHIITATAYVRKSGRVFVFFFVFNYSKACRSVWHFVYRQRILFGLDKNNCLHQFHFHYSCHSPIAFLNDIFAELKYTYLVCSCYRQLYCVPRYPGICKARKCNWTLHQTSHHLFFSTKYIQRWYHLYSSDIINCFSTISAITSLST